MRAASARRSRAVGVAALALACACGNAYPTDTASPAELQAAITELEQSLANNRIEFDSAREETLALERRLHAARQANTDLRAQLAQKMQRIADLQNEREALRTALANAAGAVESTVRSRFRHANQEKLKVLLGGDDIATLQRKLKYLDYIAAANASALGARTAQLEQLDSVEAALKLEAGKLRRLRARAERELEEINASFAVRQRLAQSLEAMLESDANALRQLRRDEGELTDLVEEVTGEAADAAPHTPFAGQKGQLAWPTAGAIAKAPGNAMRDGGAHWGGVIIDSAPGSDVTAIAAGQIAFADWFRNLGLLVIIDHGDGFMSLYGHNQKVFRQAGERVAAGDVVASVGDTGGRSRTGLYFEIRRNGEPEDPRRWCRK